MLPGSFIQRMFVILAEDRKCTSQKQRGCSVRKSWMKYRPDESVLRETDPVQRRNENSRNEKSSWFAEDGKCFWSCFWSCWFLERRSAIFCIRILMWEKWQKGTMHCRWKNIRQQKNTSNMRLERMPRGQRHIPVWQRLIWNRMKGMRQNPYFFLLLLLIHPTKNCIGQQSAFMRRQSSLIRFPRFSRTVMTNPCFPVWKHMFLRSRSSVWMMENIVKYRKWHCPHQGRPFTTRQMERIRLRPVQSIPSRFF